jgi:hypothetical protein
VTAIPFPLRSAQGPVKFMGDPRLKNCFPEELGKEQRSPVGFVAIPGQLSWATVAGIPSRGAIYLPELSAAYSIHGQSVYKIAADGTSSALTGTIPGAKPVVIERGAQRYMQGAVTVSIASPAVVSWQNHRLPVGASFQFTTDGDLPTGITADTTYYVISAGYGQNSFEFSATSGGSAVNTSGTQDGNHTVTRTMPTYQIGIVSDGACYCIEDDNLIFVGWLPTDEAPNAITNLANRFVISYPGGRNFYSELNDLLSGSSLNYFTAESRPDGMVRAIAVGGDLFLGGTETGEIYQPTGDSNAPFGRLSGTFVQKGVGARDSMVIFDNALHWLANDGIVYRLSGYQPVRVSTHFVERRIAAVADITTICGFVDITDGHSFYVLTCDAWTLVYDAATQSWAERASYQRADWNAWPYVQAFGKRLVGDKQNGVFSALSDDYLTENGKPIRAELILPDIPGRLQFNRLELDLATGEGLGVVATTDGYEPEVMLTWSDDGGATWAQERRHSVGRQGEFGKIVKFNRLGTSRTIRGRRFKITMSAPVRKAFMLGDIAAEQVPAW